MLIPALPSTDPTAAGRPGRKATHVPGPEEGNCHKAGLERRCQPRKNKGDPAAGMEAVSRQRTHRESRAGLGGQAAGRGEERGTRAKGNKTGRGASENGVEGCGTGGSGRGGEEEVGGGDGPGEAGRSGGAPRGACGWGGGQAFAPARGFSPLTSSASAFHVGANAMQCPHQEAKNSTAQALRESSTAPRTVSACSSVSASDGE